MPSYDHHDVDGLEDPSTILEELLACEEIEAERTLVRSHSFFDSEEAADFDSMLLALVGTFDDTLSRLVISLGQPAFVGTPTDQGFPLWAQTGLRVAYWKLRDRVVYLHITHVDKEMPLELTIGVVTGPPDMWFVGVGIYEG